MQNIMVRGGGGQQGKNNKNKELGEKMEKGKE